MAPHISNDLRDQLITAFRERVCDHLSVAPFLHQREVWAASDGLILTGQPDEHGPSVRLEDGNLIRVETAPRPGGRAHFVSDMGAFKIGKALSIATPIPTPHGWRPLGDLQPGDEVFDGQGRPTRIREVTPTHRDPSGTFLVRFNDGATLIASGQHLWVTSCGLRTTRELRSRHWIPLAADWQLPDRVLPIEPYLLGCWLGDGTAATGVITTADSEILPPGAIRVPSARYAWRIPGLTAALTQAGLIQNKHIPNRYLFASTAQRVALLQGLMDTDGTVNTKGLASFTNTNRALARGLYQLAASLGLKPTWHEGRARLGGRDIGPKFLVGWTAVFPSFRLARKQCRVPRRCKSNQDRRYIASVQRIEPHDVRCLTVTALSGTFLAGEASIVTHNSYGAALWATGFAAVPGAQVAFLGFEYDICGPEFTYLCEFLLSERGMNLPYDSMQNRPRDGKMWLDLKALPGMSAGAHYEARSWDRKDSLKGKEHDCYIACEAYQLPGLECFTGFSQNLRARRGYYYFATTPDRPWVKALHDLGHGADADWHCTCAIPAEANPYTFDARAKVRDKALMTSEKYAIHYQGQMSDFVGRVFPYQRGQRLCTATTHPMLFAGSITARDQVRIPPGWELVGGADTGTYYSALIMAFSPEGEAFVIDECPNYRYVGGAPERNESLTVPQWAAQVCQTMSGLGGRPLFWADPNSQFKTEVQHYGMTLLPARTPVETRTEIAREYLEHGRVWFMPWITVLPFELELAAWPEEATTAGKFARVKDRDHTLDPFEHILARRPSGHVSVSPPARTWAEATYGRPATSPSPNVHLGRN